MPHIYKALTPNTHINPRTLNILVTYDTHVATPLPAQPPKHPA